ncbi:hypothetical protein ACLESD_33085 [Pyxidicoccus sp. 3LFB2]
MRASFLVAVLLVLGPLTARAVGDGASPTYTQGSEGYVYVKDVSGIETQTRKHNRAAWRPVYRLTATVQNRLDVEVFDLRFELTWRAPGRHPYKDLLVDGVIREARSQSQMARGFFLDGSEPVGSDPILVSYRLWADPARTPGVTRALLLLANSQGPVDLAVAANTLAQLEPSATLVRDEARAWVTGGVRKMNASIGAGIAPLFVLRVLGRVGTAEDVSLLLSLLKSPMEYGSARDSVKALSARLPEHPMAKLFASGPTLDRVVADALRDMRPEVSIPALVALAHQDVPLHREAYFAIRRWNTAELVEGLRGPGETASLQLLCASPVSSAVPLILGLGMAGVDGVDLKACLSSKTEMRTEAALVAVLGEELGPLEATVLSLLEARGRAALPLLRERALELGLPVSQDPGRLARAIHERLRAQRAGALRETLAKVDGALKEDQFETALSLLDTASKEAHGREEAAKVLVARMRVAQAAARVKRVEPLARALEGVPVPRAGLKPHPDVALELMELGRVLVSQWDEREGRERLDRLEALVGTERRPELARVYMASLGEGRQEWERVAYAQRALALDPDLASARQLVDAYERQQAQAQSRRTMAINAAWLLGLAVFAWFVVSRLRAVV